MPTEGFPVIEPLLDRDLYDGLLFEQYVDRIGSPASFLTEDDKDRVGLLYAEAEATGANPADADDPAMVEIDRVAKALVKTRVLARSAESDQPAPGQGETRRRSRNFQRAQALSAWSQ